MQNKEDVMKKYLNPNAEILYLSTNDVIQTSVTEAFIGDGAQMIPDYWEALL